MSRIGVFLLVLLLASCGGGGDGDTQTASQDAAPATSERGPGTPAIPDDELSDFDKIVNAHLRPFFDAEGTETEADVAPGEYFDLYVFAEYNTLYPMSAAEYKLVLPQEVSVMGSVQADSTILSLGKHDQDFLIAFHCVTEAKWWVVKYQCKAHEDFKGGTIETTRGDGLDFLGFTLCDVTKTLVRAKGGTAVLKKK